MGDRIFTYSATVTSWSPPAFLAVNGKTSSPDVEYFIVDSWAGTTPYVPPSTTWRSSYLSLDSTVYDIYEGIAGSKKTFWAVSQTKKSSGTINVREHLNSWRWLWMETGSVHGEQKVVVVGGQGSSGNVQVVVGEVAGPNPVLPVWGQP